MHVRSNRVRVLSLVATLTMAAGPIALANPADDTQTRPADPKPKPIVPKSDQQGTPAKGAVSSPTAAAPKAAPGPTSFLPRAGADSTPSSPGVGTSRNPYRPQSVDMIRQSNRLKAKGYGTNVMNDGEIVLELNAAIKLLARVDDEYRGHRTKAIQEIEDAVHQIKTKAGKAGAKNATPARTGSKSAMPQPESDALVREANKTLEKIVFQINHGGNVKRLAPARASVKKAIEELNLALEAR